MENKNINMKVGRDVCRQHYGRYWTRDLLKPLRTCPKDNRLPEWTRAARLRLFV